MKSEEMAVENPFDLIYGTGKPPFPAVWVVRVWYQERWNNYAVQGSEKHTGAKVPAAEPRTHKTLGQARADARHLLAILGSRMSELPWRSEEGLER